MLLNRRDFTGGALGLALGSQLAFPALAQSPRLSAAIAAIRSFAEAQRNFFNLPGLTVGLTAGGFSTALNLGFADRDTRSPIGRMRSITATANGCCSS